ncbi:MAG: capsular polysaccharide biosynthesis protein [Pseudomonadota bacterium]
MPSSQEETDAGAPSRRRLCVYNGGFLTQKRVRRILHLAGYDLSVGLPRPGDAIGIWGHSPTSHRGQKVADRKDAPIIRIEDAFLRSVLPGRSGAPPLGLTVDSRGMHYDPAQPSDLEVLLATHPLDDTALLNRARAALERIKEAHLTKYTGFDPTAPCPKPGYVLVLDQTRDDASVTKSGADRARFLEMLVFAQEEHPGKRILIKTHPDTLAGHRPGYFEPGDSNHNVVFFSHQVSPWELLTGAAAVYTVSSQLGFEAIFAGHKPRVFGQPFYAGWGLTEDEYPLSRRQRRLSRTQLFAAAMILYPHLYDPYRDTLCTLESVIDTLDAQSRAWREDRKGWIASGMRLWKRGPLQSIFGQTVRMSFSDDPEQVAQALETGKRHMIWSSNAAAPRSQRSVNVEDGFLRSRGLGAELVPPLSLVLDDMGIYYDPTRPSRLEELIRLRAVMRPDQIDRARELVSVICHAGLSKYNVGEAAAPDLPEGHRILVPGQVEDDASILKGTRDIRSNLGLLSAARTAHPGAVLIYKPHPDVEAGLRPGKIEAGDLKALETSVLTQMDAARAIDLADEVWTLTSLLGFEALLRGKAVTCLGAPFYAGWSLTTDLGPVPARRSTKISLEGLAHAVLIDYPRYFDPVSKQPCPPEVIAERLATGSLPPASPRLSILAKLQGIMASRAHLWRR